MQKLFKDWITSHQELHQVPKKRSLDVSLYREFGIVLIRSEPDERLWDQSRGQRSRKKFRPYLRFLSVKIVQGTARTTTTTNLGVKLLVTGAHRPSVDMWGMILILKALTPETLEVNLFGSTLKLLVLTSWLHFQTVQLK